MPITNSTRGPDGADELRLPAAASTPPGSVEATVELCWLTVAIQRIAK